MTDKIVILVTCASEDEAEKLARALVEERLAACVNIHGAPIRSIYRWEGKVERSKEHLLIIKSTLARFPALRDAISKVHSYDLPEIIALPIAAGSDAYLNWLGDSVGPSPQRRHLAPYARRGKK